jgi:hypothetical protein
MFKKKNFCKTLMFLKQFFSLNRTNEIVTEFNIFEKCYYIIIMLLILILLYQALHVSMYPKEMCSFYKMKDFVSVTNFPTGENFNQAHFMLGENNVLGRILRGMFENEKSI